MTVPEKNHRVHFRMDEPGWLTVCEKADQSDVTMSEFFRRLALGKRVPRGVPALNREAWLKLANLENLVNQIAMKIHFGEVTTLSEEMERVLFETREQIRVLRNELREGSNREIEP